MLPFLDGDALAVDLPPKSVRGGPRRLEPVPELLTLTVADFADSVLRDVDAAGFERFVLVGHSMGGLTISEVAGRVPDRVERLVYVSCMVPPEGASAIEALPEDLRAMTREAVEEARQGGDNPIGGLDEQTTRTMFCNNMQGRFCDLGERVNFPADQPKHIPVTLGVSPGLSCSCVTRVSRGRRLWASVPELGARGRVYGART